MPRFSLSSSLISSLSPLVALCGRKTRALSLLFSLGLLVASMGSAMAAAPGAPVESALGVPVSAEPVQNEAEAKALLRRPAGTISFGGTNQGRLLAARRLPNHGRHYTFFPHIPDRGMVYATDELAGLFLRAARAVARRYPHSIMRIGNIAAQHGGRTKWHASHQSGRDGDIAFYVTDAKGHPQVIEDFVKMDRRGHSLDGLYRFDVPRNLALVSALVRDEKAPVQYIFIYRQLKKLLLARAKKEGVDPELIRRLGEVLRQPSDSARHDDHCHVRIYCSLQDRKYGCRNRGPLRDWVDMQDEAWEAHVARVVSVLELKSASLRRRAVALLESIRAASALPRLVEALSDSDTEVRRAALHAVAVIGDPVAGPGLLRQLKLVDDPRWAAKIFEVYHLLRPDDLLATARRMILHSGQLIHARLGKGGLASLQVIAAHVLSEVGQKRDVPALIALLGSSSSALRVAAHGALLQITNQRVRGKPQSRAASQRRRLVSRWKSFWRSSSAQPWLKWMRRGFRSHGVRLRGSKFQRRDLPRLLRAIRHRNPVVSENARRVLTVLTGHDYRPKMRSRRREIRRVYVHWRWWTRRHRRELRFSKS